MLKHFTVAGGIVLVGVGFTRGVVGGGEAVERVVGVADLARDAADALRDVRAVGGGIQRVNITNDPLNHSDSTRGKLTQSRHPRVYGTDSGAGTPTAAAPEITHRCAPPTYRPLMQIRMVMCVSEQDSIP